MSENSAPPSKGFTIDWLVKGVLTKAGDAFDNFTGRKWQPASGLATSGIIERLNALIDKEARDLGPKGKFVPHNIRLKVDWETFGSDSGGLLERLERELTVALIDHINDCRYHTYAPLDLQVKTDYFTKGVKLTASFEEAAEGEVEIDLGQTQPKIQVGEFIPEPAAASGEHPEAVPVAEPSVEKQTVFVKFGDAESVLTFEGRERVSVGRAKENGLVLDDSSVSKTHAALVFNSQGNLLVADIGSTNGTFIKDERIEYGAAVEVPSGTEVKFGELSVTFEYSTKEASE